MTQTGEAKYPPDYTPSMLEGRLGVNYSITKAIDAIWCGEWENHDEICAECGEKEKDCACAGLSEERKERMSETTEIPKRYIAQPLRPNPEFIEKIDGDETYQKGQDCKVCFKKANLKITI